MNLPKSRTQRPSTHLSTKPDFTLRDCTHSRTKLKRSFSDNTVEKFGQKLCALVIFQSFDSAYDTKKLQGFGALTNQTFSAYIRDESQS